MFSYCTLMMRHRDIIHLTSCFSVSACQKVARGSALPSYYLRSQAPLLPPCLPPPTRGGAVPVLNHASSRFLSTHRHVVRAQTCIAPYRFPSHTAVLDHLLPVTMRIMYIHRHVARCGRPLASDPALPACAPGRGSEQRQTERRPRHRRSARATLS